MLIALCGRPFIVESRTVLGGLHARQELHEVERVAAAERQARDPLVLSVVDAADDCV